ncbi:phage protein NinX family protein [Xenorhabdus innexi]|uniref:DUF2591 domain-containing protein n=1 Tax=Xenorhabdus innexi TaxID=290109 RepID=A0A1N6N1W0_9GAMM|nr:phage protein NinX family protein [Xenorhabdus innexi]PHM37158.1 hypothetical protein Xinn_01125 [Xenorhabdus innexi]SIP75060.1 conserved hypothetical protein [Xenorhabdus innexi]
MKLKTSELTGRALDFSVAQAIGMDIYICGRASDDEYGWIGYKKSFGLIQDSVDVAVAAFEKPVITVGFCGEICIESQTKSQKYSPSTNWEQCGQLIDIFGMELTNELVNDTWRYYATCPHLMGEYQHGDTPKIAICRAVVAAELGNEVDIPDELLEGE